MRIRALPSISNANDYSNATPTCVKHILILSFDMLPVSEINVDPESQTASSDETMSESSQE